MDLRIFYSRTPQEILLFMIHPKFYKFLIGLLFMLSVFRWGICYSSLGIFFILLKDKNIFYMLFS